MSTDFFGTKVTAGATTPFVPRPSDDNLNEALVLLNATIPASCKLPKGTRISLLVKTETCDSVALATLTVADRDNAKMDIALDSYAEFSIMGPKAAEIHVTGHYMPKQSAGDDDDGDSDGNPLVNAFQGLLGAPSGYKPGQAEDDNDEDYEDEDSDEDDDDDIVDEADIEALQLHANHKKPKVEITQVKGDTPSKDDPDDSSEDDGSDDENEGEGQGTLAGRGQDANDDEVEDDEDQDDEDDNMESDEDESEEENGEEEDAAVKENGKPVQPVAAKDGKRGPPEPSAAPAQKRMKHTKFANGFEVQQVRESSNPAAPQAQLGKTIVVKYRGMLPNGKVFDETTGKKTFSFRLGVGEVIKGWDKGLAGMRVGDKRKLIVPPSMAYGDTGVPEVIPKNATLRFEVELLRVKDGKR